MRSLAVLFVVTLGLNACSRAPDTSATQPTPRPDLRADADRLQKAINKAAEQRKQQAGDSPTASPR